jgi:hypothetical protein
LFFIIHSILMKKKILFSLSFLLSFSFFAQTTETIHIDWGIGSTPNVPESQSNHTNKTIEVGDTVIWTWTDTQTHNVHNQSGSKENFDSGLLSGVGTTFSYTFTEEGINGYQCDPHASSMFGTITVVPDGSLAVDDLSFKNTISVYPNPSSELNSNLNIQLPKMRSGLKLEVFDILGKKIHSTKIDQISNSVKISSWNSGVYLLKIFDDKMTITKKFVKN